MSDAQIDFDDALSRAFASIVSASKDNKGNFGTYATLASVTEAIKPALVAEGFSWPQVLDVSEDGRTVIVTTTLRRKGLSLSSVLPMPVGKPGPHGIGSAITYARRYALAAICGVCPEDDDGQAAQDSSKKTYAKRTRKPDARGGWEQHASDEVKALLPRYRELAKQRADLSRQTDIKTTPIATAMREFAGKGPRALFEDFSADDWRAVIVGLEADVVGLAAAVDIAGGEDAAQ